MRASAGRKRSNEREKNVVMLDGWCEWEQAKRRNLKIKQNRESNKRKEKKRTIAKTRK